METGPPPKIPYVAGGRFVAPGRDPVLLPTADRGVSGVVPYRGGLLVSDTQWFEGTNGLELVRDGQIVSDWPGRPSCSSGAPRASDNGQRVAWVSVVCPESGEPGVVRVHTARRNGSDHQSIDLPHPSSIPSIVAVLGNSVIYSRPDGAYGWEPGSPPTQLTRLDRVLDIATHSDKLIGAEGDRAAYVQDAAGKELWRTKGGRGELVAFSPDDESLVLGFAGQPAARVL